MSRFVQGTEKYQEFSKVSIIVKEGNIFDMNYFWFHLEVNIFNILV